MIRSYTLDCGCFFEHSKKAGCSSYELTNTCASHVVQGKRPLPLSSAELPPEPFLRVPQAGGPSRAHQECPGCDDPMCHKYTGKVTQRVTTLGELLGTSPMDDRGSIASLNGRKPFACDYCEQSFDKVVERIEHERTHKQWDGDDAHR